MVVLLTAVGFIGVAFLEGLWQKHKEDFANYQESFLTYKAFPSRHDAWWSEHGEKLRKVA